jgi:hypothetical protein
MAVFLAAGQRSAELAQLPGERYALMKLVDDPGLGTGQITADHSRALLAQAIFSLAATVTHG